MPKEHSTKTNSMPGLPSQSDAKAAENPSGKDYGLLLKHADRLLANPRHREVAVPGGFVSIAYIGGSALHLGTLLRLWQSGTAGWSGTCSRCGGKFVILGYGGSPLSGGGSGWGVCACCDAFIRVRFNTGHALEALRLAESSPSAERHEAPCRPPRQSSLAEWNARAAVLEKTAPKTARRPRPPKKEKRIPSILEVAAMLRALERQRKA